jgi:hypothetical protein
MPSNFPVPTSQFVFDVRSARGASAFDVRTMRQNAASAHRRHGANLNTAREP